MTPLGASLAFIIISILISVIKHFIFPSNSPSTSNQSSIQLTKLYTITDKRSQKQNKSYSSFYEAYHQFHLSQMQQQKHRIQDNFMKQYNSLVMKKSIINDEFTIICEENYLITIQEGINCYNLFNNSPNINSTYTECSWSTNFNVYQLPLLKQQTKQTITVQGRLDLSKKQGKQQFIENNLQCKKIPNINTKKYLLSFPLSNKNSTNNEQTWTLNQLFITKIQPQQKINKNDKQKSGKSKKLQAKRYNIPKNDSPPKKISNQSFELDVHSFGLQKSFHIPSVFYLNQKGLCYATNDEPWLIRYKINKQWKQIKILQKQIQKKIYKDYLYLSRLPLFDRNQKIIMKNLFLFQSKQQIHQNSCQDPIQKDDCNSDIKNKEGTYLTVVYLHINNQYRVEKFYAQLTFQIDTLNDKEVIQNNQIQNGTFPSSLQMLASYSLLISQMNPIRQIYSDCSINLKKQNIYERYFDKYYWLYENKLISALQTYSLFCVFRFDIDENLRTIQISDLIHSSAQINSYPDLAFLDWKSLQKIINYKQSFEQQIFLKNNQLKQRIKNGTRNKNQIKKNMSEIQINNKNKQHQKTQDQIVQDYFNIIKEQFQSTNPKKQLQKTSKSNDIEGEQKKKVKKKSNQGQKKSKKDNKRNNKKKKKDKYDVLIKENITLIQGQHKPTVQTSYNYSFIRKTVFPHRSQVRKYKFPLPFLLSFTKNMQIVDADIQKPSVLFSGVRQYLFTYKHKPSTQNSTLNRIVDYRYLTLGSRYKYSSKIFTVNEGMPQHEIQTIGGIIKGIEQKSKLKQNQKITIEIKDETHPEIQNVIKTMYQSDGQILNQIKSIKSIPVSIKRNNNNRLKDSQNNENQIIPQTYQRYLIVVWGWGIQVYLLDWDKDGFLRQNITEQQIQQQLSKQSSNLIEYFLPFIELFATFYCMFQALISSR